MLKQVVTITGGCTPYLQAGDIGIFQILKDKLSEIINKWNISDQVEYTRHGNQKAPLPEIVEARFRDAWSPSIEDLLSLFGLGLGLGIVFVSGTT